MLTYRQIVVDYCQQKVEPNRSQLTIRSDQIQYLWDLTMAKLHFNSSIFMSNAKFFTVDVKNFYLKTQLDWLEYIHLHIDLIPNEIIHCQPLTFVLVLDDFWIKFDGTQYAKYLLNTMAQYYEVSVDWSGCLFCGILLKWDYVNESVDFSMPN